MIWSLVLFFGGAYGGGTPVRIPCQVTPRVIEAGAFYDGARVRIEGVVAPDTKVIVTVTGASHEETFNRKARFGPAWLSAGKVRISEAPSLYLRFSSERIAAMGVAGFDEAALMARMRLAPPPPDSRAGRKLLADYLALKKEDGMYGFAGQGVVLGPAGEDGAPFRVDFLWPKKAPPAEYQVHVYEVRGGAVSREGGVPIAVVRTGFPAWLANLAETRAPVYGVTAIVIGVLAGFGIDFLVTSVFGKKRTVAH